MMGMEVSGARDRGNIAMEKKVGRRKLLWEGEFQEHGEEGIQGWEGKRGEKDRNSRRRIKE